MNHITPEVAAIALTLLDRVQVTGREAVAWVRCVQALEAVARAPAEAPGEGGSPTPCP